MLGEPRCHGTISSGGNKVLRTVLAAFRSPEPVRKQMLELKESGQHFAKAARNHNPADCPDNIPALLVAADEKSPAGRAQTATS